jgi:YidC/Oxa1 family membrane protein insertase
MDTRRTILLMVFIGSVFLLWDAWTRQSMTQNASSPVGAVATGSDASAPAVGTGVGAVATAPAPGAASASVPAATLPTPSLTAPPPAAAAPVLPEAAKGQAIVLQNRDLYLEVSTLGGNLVTARLLDQQSDNYDDGVVRLFDGRTERRYEAQSGLVAGAGRADTYPNHTLVFSPQPLKSDQDPKRTVVLASESGGLKLLKTISIEPTGHAVRISHTVLNTGADTLAPNLYLQFLRNGNAPPGESQFYMTFTGPAIYTDQGKFQKIDFSDIEKGRQDFVRQANDGWMAIVQHYFVSAWVLKNDAPREFYTRKVGDNLYTAGLIQAFAPVSPGAQQTHDAILYVGPQAQRTLEALAPGLDLVVDYGFLTFLAQPIYWLLEQLHKLVANWGWAIVLLTILIKLAFYPLSAASYKSMAKMKAVAPRLVALRERYGSDKAKLNQAMMELYKTEKINPLGGCLPVVIQIPVFLALYWVLLASVEMRNAPWALWITDLSTPDPYYILPIVMAITMFIQTKLNPAPPDPLQAKVMMAMPIVFSVFFFFFPSGLVLYWLVNNVVSIAQQWLIMKRMNVV